MTVCNESNAAVSVGEKFIFIVIENKTSWFSADWTGNF